MKTALSHRQTKTPGVGSFGLPVLAGVKALSPYYQVGLTGRLTHSSENPLMKAIVGFQQPNGSNFEVNVGFVSGSAVTDGEYLTLTLSGITDDVSYRAAIVSAITAYATAHSLTLNEGIVWPYPTNPQDIVSGVSKASTYFVTGAPVVAGGAGVVRFYIDSNGDGSGTAPSEVYASSLQAVVVNGTNLYQITAVTVDVAKKYIDIGMKALTFTGITLLSTNILGSVALNNAANGIAVNCLVLVKQ